jgi:hypothetical protein
MFLGSIARPERKANNLTVICEPIVYTMWDPQHLTTLYASTACYGDSFTFLLQRLVSNKGTMLTELLRLSRWFHIGVSS